MSQVCLQKRRHKERLAPFFSYPFADWMALKTTWCQTQLPSLELEQIKAESETDAENEDEDPEDDVDSVDPSSNESDCEQ